MRDQPDRGRFPIGPGDGNDRNGGTEHGRSRSGIDAIEPARNVSRGSRDGATGVERPLEHRGQLAGKRLGRRLPTPRKGDHHLVRLRTRPSPDRQVGAGGIGQGTGQVDRETRNITTPLLALRHPRMVHGVKAGPSSQPLRPIFGQAEPGRHRQRQLDRRAGEVEVGSVEHSELDQLDAISLIHQRATIQSRRHHT